MNTSTVRFFHRIIEYAFYALFFLIPLVFTSNTSELFEFNKIWLTFALTIIIVAAWVSKMILQRKIFVMKTPLDIPILLFTASQVISTIFSLDSHVSLWGYYSRFNGGLLSIISYIILYYAFVTNLSTQVVIKRLLLISLASGTIVALWGLPSHFGYDPTCLLFRGNLDVSCWTDAFKPTIRIFSTLGQPNWLAAYMAILLPIAMAFALQKTRLLLFTSLLLLFFLDLIYTNSQSGFLGAMAGLFFFLGILLINKAQRQSVKLLLGLFAVFFLLLFFVGIPITALQQYTFPHLKNQLFRPPQSQQIALQTKEPLSPNTVLETNNITGSGKIRNIVWSGALEIWKHNPLFGSGVETFAFAYYKYRPVEHNLTSEWDYLYNKAHNEYLNFLATTGAFGLGTYLLLIGWFLIISVKRISNLSGEARSSSAGKLVIIALLSAYISILVTNFFGFSVVIINLYFFLIPAFVFTLLGITSQEKLFVLPNVNVQKGNINGWPLTGVIICWIIALYCIFVLFQYWRGDQQYYLGSNFNKIGRYQEAYSYLRNAILLRGDEPVFKDEASMSSAVLAVGFAQANDATTAAILVQEALAINNQVIADHPNNVVFWKTRTRVLYTLSQLNKQYLPLALQAIQQANALAPTDAKVSYNLGLLYGQNGDSKKAVEILERTVKLKPDYRDAYYAFGLFYHELAIDKNGKVVNQESQNKAIETMRYILSHISRNDSQAKEALKTWGEQ